MTRSSHRLGTVLAGLALSAFAIPIAIAGSATTAAAITTPPPRFTNPCVHVAGTPDPCAPVPTEPPEPIDPGCLRVDVDPRQCPYQP